MRAVALVLILMLACDRPVIGEEVAACHIRGGRYLLHPENEPDLEQLGYPHCIGGTTAPVGAHSPDTR